MKTDQELIILGLKQRKKQIDQRWEEIKEYDIQALSRSNYMKEIYMLLNEYVEIEKRLSTLEIKNDEIPF